MIADLRRHRHDVNMTFQFRQDERVPDGRIVLRFAGLPEPDGYHFGDYGSGLPSHGGVIQTKRSVAPSCVPLPGWVLIRPMKTAMHIFCLSAAIVLPLLSSLARAAD